MALLLSPRAFLAFNENLQPFHAASALARRRSRGTVTVAGEEHGCAGASGRLGQADWRLLREYAAGIGGGVRCGLAREAARRQGGAQPPRAPGITVVIPSRTAGAAGGATCPGSSPRLPAQIVVVDNGCTDDTAAWLARDVS